MAGASRSKLSAHRGVKHPQFGSVTKAQPFGRSSNPTGFGHQIKAMAQRNYGLDHTMGRMKDYWGSLPRASSMGQREEQNDRKAGSGFYDSQQGENVC